MYRALGDFDGGDGYTDLSFREPERWATMATAGSRVEGVALHSSGVVFGDEESGPIVLLLALGPNVKPPEAPAHSHASDSWRISLLGKLPLGRDSYEPGEFTFRQGWKPYASDNYANGPEGGWTALVFGDRRGTRVRHIHHEGPTIKPVDRRLGEWLGVAGDLLDEDGADAVGESTMLTTLDDVRKGPLLNGSFHDTSTWICAGALRLAVGLVGQAEWGPAIVMSSVDAGGTAFGSCVLDSELFRLVVRGSHELDGRTYEPGDMRVQRAGLLTGKAVAGVDGVDEVIVVADRRSLRAELLDDGDWATAVSQALADLEARRA